MLYAVQGSQSGFNFEFACCLGCRYSKGQRRHLTASDSGSYAKGLILVHLNGQKTKPAQGGPLSAGILAAEVLETLRKANGPGVLESPKGVLVCKDDKELPAGRYNFWLLPASQAGM